MSKPKTMESHVLLRRRDNSVRLILPTANSHVLRSGLRMYFPSRLLGKLYRWLLYAFLPLQTRLGLAEIANDAVSWCPHGDHVLSFVPDAQVGYLCALVAEPGQRSKLTLKIMDHQGVALAYGRVAYTAHAIEVIRREAAVLRKLQEMPIAPHVPRVISSGDLVAPIGYFLLETPGPDMEAGRSLTAAHFKFLSELVSDVKISWVDILAQLKRDVAPLIGDEYFCSMIARTLQWLQLEDLPDVPVTIEHGDFTPWNIRISDEGKLYVLDWESSYDNGLPWLDALHFVFQYAVLVKSSSNSVVKDIMKSVFHRDEANHYKNLCGLPDMAVTSFIVLYLVRRIATVAKIFGAEVKTKEATALAILEDFVAQITEEQAECHFR